MIFTYIALVGAAVFGLWHYFPDTLNSQEGKIQLISTLGILSYLMLSFSRRRADLSQTVRHGLVWVGIFIFGLWIYSFKDRITGVLNPSEGQKQGHQITYKVSNDQHFYINAKVNGQRIRFLVDSGASSITLAPADAKRLGFDLDKLNYNRPTQTAGGQTFSASITLDSLRIDTFNFQDVPAQVPQSGLETSLLGMAFLSRLKSWRVDGDELVLEF